MKVSATPTALELIEDLKKTHGKDLLFHQSGGCYDGSAPMCYPAKEYLVGDQDVLIGEIGGIPCLLYTSPSPRDLSTSRMPSSA